MEIYDEDTLNPFELDRQKNIIKNYEFMKVCLNRFIYLGPVRTSIKSYEGLGGDVAMSGARLANSILFIILD